MIKEDNGLDQRQTLGPIENIGKREEKKKEVLAIDKQVLAF